MRGKYTQQRFNLRDALAQLTQKQYENAYGIRQKELDTEEEARQFNERLAAEERARRAAAAGGGGGGGAGLASPSFGYGPGGDLLGARTTSSASNPVKDMIALVAKLRGQGLANWRDVEAKLRNQGIDVSRGSVADYALHAQFEAPNRMANYIRDLRREFPNQAKGQYSYVGSYY